MLKEQIIDVTRSFLVTDPEAFYENLMVPQREDAPEKMLPIVAYEGYNFLPTLYGYRSYFDATSKLDIASLASRCDRIVLYQFANYQNILVALCEDGIWTNSGGTAAEAWNHRVTLSTPGVGSYLEWTFCVIENTLYMYRQGGSVVYTVKPTSYALGNPVENFAPSFLNMSGQMGIFRANGRLGFWDSANSVSWSSLFSFSDFTPSVETLAGFAIFNDILGRIVTIKSHGSGFIIYSTKNIVGVSYEATGSVLFSARTIAEVAGIWTSKQVCSGAVDTEQFAYTNTGIKHISAGFKIEDIFPGVYDFLKESREPVYMDFLNGRYLFLSLIDPDYISGKVSFSLEALPPATYVLRFVKDGVGGIGSIDGVGGGGGGTGGTGGAEVTSPDDLPTDIAGIAFPEDLYRKIIYELSSDGIYAQWNAAGSKICPGRISSMEPFLTDDPTTPDDDHPYVANTDPLITEEQIITLRDEGTWTNPMSINNALPSVELEWADAGAGTGQIDVSLNRMMLRQKKEWDENQELVANAVEAIDAYPGTATPMESYHICPIDGQGPSTHVTHTENDTYEPVSDPYLYVNGTLSVAVTGIGAGSPELTYKKTFTDRYEVKRKEAYRYQVGSSKTFWGQVYAVINDFFNNVHNGMLLTLTSAFLPIHEAIIGKVADLSVRDYNWNYSDYATESVTATIINSGIKAFPANSDNADVYSWDNIVEVAALMASSCDPLFPATVTVNWHDPYGLDPDEDVVFTYEGLGDVSLGIGSVYNDAAHIWARYSHGPIPMSRYEPFNGHISVTRPYFPEGSTSLATIVVRRYARAELIEKTRFRGLNVEEGVPSGAIESILTANQHNITWAIYDAENPPDNFDWDTNELILETGSDLFLQPTELPNSLTVTYPGSTFLLQNATTAPIYPDFAGALVYDLPLQKWGKAKCTYRCLMDYSPINSNVEQVIDYTNFGLTAGLLAADGFLRLFSANCTDSFIRYGKLAFSRIGYTYPEELVINFRMPFTGEIQTDVSMDGRSIHAALQETTAFSGVGTAKVYPSYSGQWHTFAVKGNFDIRSISYTGRVSGIR